MTIYPDRLIILADQRGNAVGYNGEILPPLYHQAYFTQIGHSFIEDPKDRLLFAQNVNLAWQKFHFNIDVNDLSSIHRVSIKTYADISIFLYLAEFNENKIGGDSRLASGFGYICYEPDCTPEKIFRVIDIEEATKPEAFKGIIIPQDS